MKKKKKDKKLYNYIKSGKLYLVLLFVCVLFLSIGYATVTGVNLTLSGTAEARLKELVITNVTYQSNLNADLENCVINDFYQTNLDSTVTLTNNKYAEITYTVTMKNFDTVFKKYKETAYLPELYDNADITFELNGIDTTTVIAPGESKSFTITFKYLEEQESYSNTVLNSLLNFKFETVNYVAKIGNTYYEKIQTAINTATTSDLVTIDIIADTTESTVIGSTQNIRVNMNGHTIHNNGNSPVFNSEGQFELIGGTLIMDQKQGAVNNNVSSGRVIINGTTIRATQLRQAFYNKGYAELINVDFSAVTGERAAVQNESTGELHFKSGKASNPNFYGIQNAGVLYLGEEDGIVSKTSPEIISGNNNGINGNGSIYFYDGVVKSTVKTFGDVNKVVDLEEGYGIARGEDTIGGVHYITDYPAHIAEVTFNYNGGVKGETKRNVEIGSNIGTLPSTNKVGFLFQGWYTANSGGTEVTSSTIINADTPLYAIWEATSVVVYNGVEYSSIQAAVNVIPEDGNPHTITMIDDTIENVKIEAGKNVVLDLDNHTVSNRENTKAIIENYGTITVINGTLSSTSDKHATINNYSGGVVNLGGGSITNTTTTRQAVYNKAGGTVNIYGTAHISSNTVGDAASPATLQRGTVQNESGGVINITGGTIECSTQHAVSNEGELNIGTKDGNISTTSPSLTAEMYAILNKAGATLNIYDGSFKGKSGIINGSYTEIEPNTHMTDVVSGGYHTSILEND